MDINTVFIFALAALRKAKDAIEAIINLPKPLIPKGTLGVGGTVETLPTASSENEGFYYVVITDGTYAGQAFIAGDTTFSNGTEWVRVPSGDEASVIDDSVTSTALTWSSSKLKSMVVKKFTYTGTGEDSRTIEIPEPFTSILDIGFVDDFSAIGRSQHLQYPIAYGQKYVLSCAIGASGAVYNNQKTELKYNDNTITVIGTDENTAFNINGATYTVLYL